MITPLGLIAGLTLGFITLCHTEEILGPGSPGVGLRGSDRALVGLWATVDESQRLSVGADARFWYYGDLSQGGWYLFGSSNAGLQGGACWIRRDTLIFTLNDVPDRPFKRPYVVDADTLTFRVGSMDVRFERLSREPGVPFG